MNETLEVTRLFPAYTYQAYLDKVNEDGSLSVDVDLGFDVWVRGVRVSLAGIPLESDKKLPERTRQRLVGWMDGQMAMAGGYMLLLTHPKAEDSSWPADVYYPNSLNPVAEPIYLNQALINSGILEE